RGDAGEQGAVCAGHHGAVSGARTADDPRRHDGARHDQGVTTGEPRTKVRGSLTADFRPRLAGKDSTMTHFADRLCEAIRKKGNPLCVGLDPRWESLPDEIRKNHESESIRSVSQAFGEFCLRVLDVVAPLVPVVKPQSAFFEMCGPPGMYVL